MNHAKPLERTSKFLSLVLRHQPEAMHRDGHVFFLFENGVWLTAEVPVRYIEMPAGAP